MGGWSSSEAASWARDWQFRATYQRRGLWWGQKLLTSISIYTFIFQNKSECNLTNETFSLANNKWKFPHFTRFQLRVALYIAASLGHLDLAGWLLEKRVHAEEPVGVHPYRQWCHQTAHRDAIKCPIHAAVESSQLQILKLFIAKNLLALACRDPVGRDPLKIAIQHGHRDCVRYLANKICSVISLPNMSLPMRVYLQMKYWVRVGQKRAASKLLLSTSAAVKDRVGGMLLVDGFNQPQMSSKSRKAETKLKRGIRAKALRHLPPISKSVNPGDLEETQKRWKQDVKHMDGGPEMGDSILFRGRSTLPPVTRGRTSKPECAGPSLKSSNNVPASLESFSQHCGRTPRENAIYFLSIARSL